MIPKIIHYCWFGRNEKSDVIIKCLESWRKYCPDWEIQEWNEDNFDVTEYPYMKEAYEAKKWAFVSDVARLMLVYKYGGVYMDTDVELSKNIDSWLKDEAFYFWESNRNIASGLGFGAVKGHKSVAAMLSCYEDRHFIIDGKMKLLPCPAINTEALLAQYSCIKRNGKTQQIENITLYSNEEYHKAAFHYGTSTWVSGVEQKKRVYHDLKIKHFLRDEKIFSFMDKHFNKKIVDLYTFFAYDFLELGPFYYIKRFIKK